jgi:hypothetical protein
MGARGPTGGVFAIGRGAIRTGPGCNSAGGEVDGRATWELFDPEEESDQGRPVVEGVPMATEVWPVRPSLAARDDDSRRWTGTGLVARR